LIFYYLLLAITPFHADPRVGRVLFEMGAAIITPGKIVGLLPVAGAMLVPAGKNCAPRLHTSIPWLFAPFALIPIIISLSEGLPTPAQDISQLLSAVLLLIATRALVRTRERLFKVVRTLVLAFAFSSLWVYKQHFIEHVPLSWGVEVDNNYEALMLLLSIPMAFWMARYESSRRLRSIGFCCGLLLCGALVLTGSRGGIIAGGAMGLIAAFYSRHRLKNVLLLAAVALILVNFGPEGLSKRFRSIKLTGHATNGDEESTRIHVELLKAGLYMMQEHPLLGIGLEQFKPNAPFYNSQLTTLSRVIYIAHDTFVQLGSECGIPVLLLFVAMLVITFHNFKPVLRAVNPPMAELGLAFRSGLVGISVAAFSITVEYLPFWIFIFLSLSFREISSAELSYRVAETGSLGGARYAAGGNARREQALQAHADLPYWRNALSLRAAPGNSSRPIR